MKRCRLVTAAATAAMVGILGFSAPAFAASGYGNVEVKTDTANKSITIGNDAFARTFSFKDGKLKTTLIDNKLGNTKIVPGDKSEEFLIEGMFEGTRQEPAEGTLHSVKPARGGAAVDRHGRGVELEREGELPCVQRYRRRHRNLLGEQGWRREHRPLAHHRFRS